MAAQVVTPIFSGWLMDMLGLKVLCPYAALFSAIAFFTMLPVRHGDVLESRLEQVAQAVDAGESPDNSDASQGPEAGKIPEITVSADPKEVVEATDPAIE